MQQEAQLNNRKLGRAIILERYLAANLWLGGNKYPQVCDGKDLTRVESASGW